MAGDGRLQADPLFQGLTRPAMIMGVSYLYFVVNSLLCLIFFINTSNLLILFVVAPIMHAIGYFICLREPRAIEISLVKWGKTMPCPNYTSYGYNNSYDVF